MSAQSSGHEPEYRILASRFEVNSAEKVLPDLISSAFSFMSSSKTTSISVPILSRQKYMYA
jgi:hypothetical protein